MMKLDGSGTDPTIVTVPAVLLYCSESVLDAKKVFKLSIKLIVNVSPGAGGNAVLEVTLRVANKSGDELTWTSLPSKVKSPPMKVSLGVIVVLTSPTGKGVFRSPLLS